MLYGQIIKSVLLPESAQPYALKFLDGKLAVVFQLKNQDELMQINAHLDQRDGEVLHAKVVRGNEPENAGQRNKRSAPCMSMLDGET